MSRDFTRLVRRGNAVSDRCKMCRDRAPIPELTPDLNAEGDGCKSEKRYSYKGGKTGNFTARDVVRLLGN